MAHQAQPEFTGIQKYPGVIATIFTIIIATVFIGALYAGASGGGHGGDHGGEHAEEAH